MSEVRHGFTSPLNITTQGAHIGVSDNSIANAGEVGQILTATNSGSASTSAHALSSVSLTTGSWLIGAGYEFNGSGGDIVRIAINTIINSFSGTIQGYNSMLCVVHPSIQSGGGFIPRFPVYLSSTTTYYLNVVCNSLGSGTEWGSIVAVRFR